jgi:hypothetical protein
MEIIKISFSVHLKYSNYWSSADVKPMPKCLVRAKPLQCMFALYVCTLQSDKTVDERETDQLFL